MKIAVFDSKPYDRESFAEFNKEVGNPIEFTHFEPRLSLETVKLAAGFDGVCCFVNDDSSAEVVAALSEMGIKVIAQRCAGFDRLDLQACADLGITVVRVPAYSPYAVAEFALGMLLTLNRKLHLAYNRVRDGNFTLNGLVGFDLHGKTVGVVGTGKIGQCFMDVMIGCGCKILAYDIFVNETYAAKPQVSYVTMDELFEKSDIISLHTPLFPSTKHLINKTSLAKMKKGCVLVNTSRGGLVDTRALISSLKNGHLGGAALDVYEGETKYFFNDCSGGVIEDDDLARLQNMRNVLITSHQAYLTSEALHGIASCTINNLLEVKSGKTMADCTNYVAAPEKNPAVVRALSKKEVTK